MFLHIVQQVRSLKEVNAHCVLNVNRGFIHAAFKVIIETQCSQQNPDHAILEVCLVDIMPLGVLVQ